MDLQLLRQMFFKKLLTFSSLFLLSNLKFKTNVDWNAKMNYFWNIISLETPVFKLSLLRLFDKNLTWWLAIHNWHMLYIYGAWSCTHLFAKYMILSYTELWTLTSNGIYCLECSWLLLTLSRKKSCRNATGSLGNGLKIRG